MNDIHDIGREYSDRPQRYRLHPLLLLSVAGARAAAHLVQVTALPIADGD